MILPAEPSRTHPELPHIVDTLGCRILHLLPGESHSDHVCALRPVWFPTPSSI